MIITLFYHFSSNLKNFYLELKSSYTKDGKYLAVITKNGLWIRDKIEDKTFIINASKMKNEFLVDGFITEFNDKYEVVQNIRSEKIDIKSNEWIIYDPIIFSNNDYIKLEEGEILKIQTNFNYEKIQGLFSNLSSLSLVKLLKLKENYKTLNYSTTEINIHLIKLLTYPLYMVLMTVFSAIIMLKIKMYEGSTFKISLGLFLSVVIYYINNFSNILGKVEKIPMSLSVLMPLIILVILNTIMINRINDK
jgi:lipopolysaccharide export system permease protein